MKELRSFLEGRWVAGKGRAEMLVNPATEEPLATTSTEGLDFVAALEYARASGEQLRSLTFARRGEALRAMARVIRSARDELIELAIANGGNTRGDAKFDIDGAAATVAAYAEVAEGLGERTWLTDGDLVSVGRADGLAAAHLCVPRHGVAVHINAFNFPAWGFAEKAAVALLAGMPVVTKPATSSALVAVRLVELVVESHALPEGTLSLIAGSAAGLVEHLGGQDVLAFTGSSATAAALRAHRAVAERSVRVNVEADSLNAAVLGPDVVPDAELANLFLADVERDMTQKAGQKCTAIRRVYVPRARLEGLVGLLRERLETVRVGDPTLDAVTMGPLATAGQLREVRAGVARLAKGAEVAFAAPGLEPLVKAKGKGFFQGPVLLVRRDARPGDAVHETEVFGPVATLMPYDGSPEQAAELVRAGGGGLVSSVYSDDEGFARKLVLAIAPFHGRLSVASSAVAGQAIPPGLVLPQLVHGGPGRAGGGEELGGRRGLALYLQRVAVQGERGFVHALAH